MLVGQTRHPGTGRASVAPNQGWISLGLINFRLITLIASKSVPSSYCSHVYFKALSTMIGREQTLAVHRNYRNAGLTEQQAAMLAYAEQIRSTPRASPRVISMPCAPSALPMSTSPILRWRLHSETSSAATSTPWAPGPRMSFWTLISIFATSCRWEVAECGTSVPAPFPAVQVIQ